MYVLITILNIDINATTVTEISQLKYNTIYGSKSNYGTVHTLTNDIKRQVCMLAMGSDAYIENGI